MNKLLTVLFLIAALTTAFNVNAAGLTCQDLNGAYVYSDEDTPIYLGFFGHATHAESIMNFSGQYGSSSGRYSVRNIAGKYGSSTSDYSANNSLAYDPPIIFKNGAYIGNLSAITSEHWADIEFHVSLAEIDRECSFTSHTPPSVAPADLAITIFDAENGVYSPDDTIPVIAKIENIGSQPSLPYRFTIYGSQDKNITTDDYGRYWDMDALAVGEAHYYTFQSSLPAHLANGEYYIGGIVEVAEDENYDNNTRYDTTPITISDSSSPFQINPGLNDAWYYPDTDGQGFFITVFPDLNYASLAWFTYDTELPAENATAKLGDPGHRWLTAGGPIVGNQVTMVVEMTSGGLFDTATLIDRTNPPGSDGTIILTFSSCNSATVEYDIQSINKQGIVPIQRVATDNVVLCEALVD